MIERKAEIRTEEIYVVDLYEDGKLVEERRIPGKSFSYAEDVKENWENGLIQKPDSQDVFSGDTGISWLV